MFILPVLIYSVLYNIPRFFEFRTAENCIEMQVNTSSLGGNNVNDDEEGQNCTLMYTLQVMEIRNNPVYISVRDKTF